LTFSAKEDGENDTAKAECFRKDIALPAEGIYAGPVQRPYAETAHQD